MSVHHRACPGRFGFGDFERGRIKRVRLLKKLILSGEIGGHFD